jgi:hypothetical protein
METIAINNGGRLPTKTEMDDYVSGVNNGTITTKPHEQYASDATQHSVWFAISEDGLSGYTTTIRPFYKITDNSGVLTGEVHNNGANPGAVNDGNHNVFKWVWYITNSTEIAFSNSPPTVTMTGTYNTDSFLSPDDNEIYEYAHFTDDGTITFHQDTVCDILMVGGGGSGNIGKGGGSSGGMLYAVNQLIPSGMYPITVGAGGVNGNGGDSVAFGATAKGGLQAITATGATNNGANIPGTTIAVWEQNKVALGGGTTFQVGEVIDSTIIKYPKVLYTNHSEYVTSSSFHAKTESNYWPWKAFDGIKNSITTAWISERSYNSSLEYTGGESITDNYGNTYTGEWIKIDLKENIVLKSYIIYPPGDSSRIRSAPGDFKIFGSKDDTTYFEVDTRTGQTWTLFTGNTFDLPGNEQSYRYYTLMVNKIFEYATDPYYVSITEWELYGYSAYTPVRRYPATGLEGGTLNGYSIIQQPSGTPDYGTGDYTITWSDQFMAELFAGLLTFDHLHGSGWHSSDASYVNGVYKSSLTSTIDGTYKGAWVKIQLPVKIYLDNFKIRGRSDGYEYWYPKDYTVYGSTDGTTWSSLVNEIAATYTNRIHSKSVESDTAYDYYAIVVNKVNSTSSNADIVNISEWELYGFESNTSISTPSGGGGIGSIGSSATTATDTPNGGDGFPVSIITPNELYAGGGGANGGERVPPSGYTIGYGGNSSETTAGDGGSGIVIIRWKKHTDNVPTFGDTIDNLLLWYNFNNKITTNVSQILLGGSGIISSLISSAYDTYGTNGINIPITGDTSVYYGGGGSGYNITSNLSGTPGFGEIGRGGDGGLITTNGNDGGIIIRVPKISNDPITISGGGGGTLQNGISPDLTTPIPNGGEGLTLPITGSLLNYAGGGGGASTETNGDRVPTSAIYGYGANSTLTSGFNGGDGIIIIKWRESDKLIPLTHKVITEGDLTGTGILKSTDVSIFNFSKILYRTNTITDGYFKCFEISVHSVSTGTLLFSGVIYRNYDVYKVPVSVDYTMMFSFYVLSDISTTTDSISFKNSTIYFEDNDICRLSPDNDDMITISSK